MLEDYVDPPEPSGLTPWSEIRRGAWSDDLFPNPHDPNWILERHPEYSSVTTMDHNVPHGYLARTYRDRQAQSAGFALIWIHGGAFAGGHLDIPEANWVALEIARSGIDVLSVDYTKAVNGARWPEVFGDIMAAVVFARGEWAREFGHEAGRIFLGGASAGASLATSAALNVSRGGQQPFPGLALAYPTLHRSLPPWERSELERVRERAGEVYFSAQWVREMGENLVGDYQGPLLDLAFPGDTDVSGLPPVWMSAAWPDTLRSSAETFRDELEKAQIPVSYDLVSDGLHGFLNDPTSDVGIRVIDDVKAWMSRRVNAL